MAESEGIEFACIGCGALNPAGAEACAGCGSRLDGPAGVAGDNGARRPLRLPAQVGRAAGVEGGREVPDFPGTPGPVGARPVDSGPRRPLPFNPYRAPMSPIAPPRTFRIGTGLLLVAVIAVCLAAFRADVGLGILASVTLVPASARTSWEAGWRRDSGLPMTPKRQFATFLMTVGASWVVVISSTLAFFLACVPVSLASNDILVGLAAGGFAAVALAISLVRLFLGVARENAAREREIRYF